VLLARLQREAIRASAVCIDGDADEPSGIERLKPSRVARYPACGPPIAHRHAEALRRATTTSAPHLAGRHEQREREHVGGDDYVAPAACTACASAR
jgi:hypothetical protein